jgi:hypothetical protein
LRRRVKMLSRRDNKGEDIVYESVRVVEERAVLRRAGKWKGECYLFPLSPPPLCYQIEN